MKQGVCIKFCAELEKMGIETFSWAELYTDLLTAV